MISRIKEVIAYYKLTDRAFAIKCGIKQNTLSRQLNGVSEISVPTINAILDNYDDISAEWLLRGKGEMLISANQSKDENTERISRLVDTIATLQGTINEQSKTIQALQEKERRLNGELAMLKNERKNG
ncbi:XRE family transcriptional regulator [Bacteroides intestinalis]|jgi:transcriptional regulator with XRE-family HTH domain|uniref:XRE family transcriptional regulator n=1 Tax=Bacteroides intestinalis TaxID=329854 RepID=UPI000E1C7E27|nr:XRE family transcriptional regulator [Bacteroides intestinalis]QDO69969.1 XRE family transcriptional regulator [Bacteroides intestinalis]UCB34154.1 XRE family transcriptional regulator [Bacteroides intestinalis]UCB38396.1 XRE family transcriptional regulator [Bacteroides intestinalis]